MRTPPNPARGGDRPPLPGDRGFPVPPPAGGPASAAPRVGAAGGGRAWRPAPHPAYPATFVVVVAVAVSFAAAVAPAFTALPLALTANHLPSRPSPAVWPGLLSPEYV